MRRNQVILLLLVFLYLPMIGWAQPHDTTVDLQDDTEVEEEPNMLDNQVYVDSLKVWIKDIDDDSTRLLYLVELAYFSVYVSPRQSREYWQQAYQLADSINSEYMDSYVLLSHANTYAVQGMYLRALELNQEAYSISADNGYHDMTGTIINNIGDSYMELSDYENAYRYFKESLQLARDSKDSLLETISMFNIGRVYKIQANYPKALEYIYSSKLLSEKIGDIEGAAYSDQELGMISYLQGEPEQAISFLEESIRISDSLGIDELKAKNMVEIANIKEEQNELMSALQYYYKALAINEKIRNQKGIAETYLGLGKLQIKMNSLESASTSLHLGLSISLALKDKKLESEFYEALSKFHESKGSFTKALDYFKKFKMSADSVFNTETNMQLALIETQFESEKKDKEIAQFKEAKAKQDAELQRKTTENLILYGGFVFILVVAILLVVNIRNKKKINDQLRAQKAEIEKKNTQLRKLNRVKDKFFSIISHDLKSPFQSLSGVLELVSINALSDKEIKELFRDLKIKFDGTNDLLENLLQWAKMQMKETHYTPSEIELNKTIDEELQVIQGYKTKEIALENKVTDFDKVYADINMLKLVIRNLINNAIKFTKQKGKIEILAEEMGEFVCVSVKDNGVGISEENLKKIFDSENSFTTPGTEMEKGTGLGLSLCKEFVEMNGGKIWVESQEGMGSTFKFTLKKAS